jgi:Tol biopolymer transport system component/DNA-binding winged helix-turn-helix (wHTH) protein
LLQFLVENQGKTVTKDEIVAAVWPGTFVSDNSVTRAVTQIRKALHDDAKEPKYIETVHTIGYRFIAEAKPDLSGDTAHTVAEALPARDPSRIGRFSRSAILIAAGATVVAAIAGLSWRGGTRGVSSARLGQPMRQTKLTYFPGEESDPAFSPDGSSVAFSWSGDQGGNPAIYVMPIADRTPIRLTHDPVNDISPAWSPDGTQIAFLRLSTISTGRLMVVPAGGGPERVIRDVRILNDIYRAMRPLLTWTPDGTAIAYTTQDDESERASLYLTDPQGKSARKLFTPDEGSAGTTAPAFSADGKWLAYAEVYGPYAARLFVRPLAGTSWVPGEAFPVTGPTGALITSPVWAPDGKRLLFMQNSNIFEWQSRRSPEQIYSGTGVVGMSIAWAPDRAMRVVTADRGQAELRVIPSQPGGLSAAGESSLFAPYTGQSSPMFSPDGKFVLFHGPRSGADEVWVVDSSGQNPRQLTQLNPATMGFPEWSPDGKRIAFHARIGLLPQIFTLDTYRILSASHDSKLKIAPTKITDSAFGFYSPTWSADGKYIYANRANGGARIFRIAVEGGTPEDLFEGVSARVTPDGRKIVYGKNGHLGMFSRSLDTDPATSPEEKLVDDYRPPGQDLNPVADGIYYIGWDGAGKPRIARFYSYARKKSADVALLPGRIPDVPGLSVSPDRRRIVYSQFTATGSDLTLIEFK